MIYVTDSLCPWCYAMGPALEDALARSSVVTAPEVLNYGLCPGEGALVIDEDMAVSSIQEIERIATRAGSVFGGAFRRRITTPGRRFDSQPASEAVVAVRRLSPAVTLDYLHRVQYELFVHGVDPENREMLIRTAAGCGVPPDEFRAMLDSEEIAGLAEADYDRSDEFGVDIIPTLLVESPKGMEKVFAGWVDRAELEAKLELSLGTR